MTVKNYQDVLDYWFEKEIDFQKWFMSGEKLDAYLRQEFQQLLHEANSEKTELLSIDDKLGMIILLDQFSRHIHRGKADAFCYDPKALSLAKAMLDSGDINSLAVNRQIFALMPFQHSEELADKKLLLDFVGQKLKNSHLTEGEKGMYRTFLSHTEGHQEVLERFGRYPKRNKALGRTSTGAELRYIEETKWRAY